MVSAKWCSTMIESHQSQEKLKVAADVRSPNCSNCEKWSGRPNCRQRARNKIAKNPRSGRAGCSCRPSGRWAEITRRHEPAALRSVGLAQFLAEKLHDHQ